MPFTVTTPRKFDFGTRLFGLQPKQWIYMGTGIVLGGLMTLGVLIKGLPLIPRLLLGVLVAAPCAGLAYLKYRGLPLDRALLAWIKYRFSPRKRVWRKGFAEFVVEEEGAPPEAPAVAVDTKAVVSTVRVVVVVLNLIVIAILCAAAIYMVGGGLKEINQWLGF
jgi:hypothetical protein